MRGRLVSMVLFCALAVVVAVAAPTAGAAPRSGPPVLENLAPGAPAVVPQDLPVSVVFVGLEPGEGPTGIDAGALVAAQPDEVVPIDRISQYVRDGVADRIGLAYDVDVRPVFADLAFEDAFFGYLAASAYGPFPPTYFQAAAGQRPGATLQIPEDWVLDATAVESWLLENAGPMLGVDVSRPTVFFVNWFGRPDFRFHTYSYFSYQPEIDLFPPNWSHLHTIAWGGGAPDTRPPATSRLGRVWFLDVSAGPEWGTSNFALDIGDIDGDGAVEERIPPIWEYGTTKWYRPFDDLSADLARVLRFVAIDGLFAASPIYPPALTPPLLDDVLELDLNVFLDDPNRDPFGDLSVAEVRRRVAGVDPSRTFTTDVEVRPVTNGLSRVIDCDRSASGPDPQACYPGATGGDPINDVFVWLEHHREDLLDRQRGEVPVAVLDVGDQRELSYSGMTVANGMGIQRWATAWTAPILRRNLFSPTGTTTHEVGHYLSLAHPHESYDSELGLDQSAYRGGAAYLLNLGDETATTMSYLHDATDFSQFDRDNLARYLVAARLSAANAILADVYASPRAGNAAAELRTADARAGQALDLVQAWQLPQASIAARGAYAAVLAAAAKAGVKVEPWAGAADEAGVGAIRTEDFIEGVTFRADSKAAAGGPVALVPRSPR